MSTISIEIPKFPIEETKGLPTDAQIMEYLEKVKFPLQDFPKNFRSIRRASEMYSGTTTFPVQFGGWVVESFRRTPMPVLHVHDGTPTKDSCLWSSASTKFKDKWGIAQEKGYSYVSERRFARINGMRGSVYNEYINFLQAAWEKEWKELFRGLRNGHHIAIRNESEIAEEILLRKAQYPGDPIYLFIQDEMEKYFRCTRQKQLAFMGAKILVVNDSYNPEDGFIDWESAIIARSQINANHDFEFEVAMENIPRWRIVKVAGIHYFDLEVLPRTGSRPITSTKRDRFTRLGDRKNVTDPKQGRT